MCSFFQHSQDYSLFLRLHVEHPKTCTHVRLFTGTHRHRETQTERNRLTHSHTDRQRHTQTTGTQTQLDKFKSSNVAKQNHEKKITKTNHEKTKKLSFYLLSILSIFVFSCFFDFYIFVIFLVSVKLECLARKGPKPRGPQNIRKFQFIARNSNIQICRARPELQYLNSRRSSFLWKGPRRGGRVHDDTPDLMTIIWMTIIWMHDTARRPRHRLSSHRARSPGREFLPARQPGENHGVSLFGFPRATLLARLGSFLFRRDGEVVLQAHAHLAVRFVVRYRRTCCCKVCTL